MFAEYKYALSFDWSKRDWLKKAIMIYIYVLFWLFLNNFFRATLQRKTFFNNMP